jgi:hypothetical protein
MAKKKSGIRTLDLAKPSYATMPQIEVLLIFLLWKEEPNRGRTIAHRFALSLSDL